MPAADVARFELADDAAIVAASFCCGFCLTRPGAVIVALRERGAAASCYCAGCDDLTEVELSHKQVVRLRYAPPPGVPIHLLPAELL